MKGFTQCKRCKVWIKLGQMKEHKTGFTNFGKKKCSPQDHLENVAIFNKLNRGLI